MLMDAEQDTYAVSRLSVLVCLAPCTQRHCLGMARHADGHQLDWIEQGLTSHQKHIIGQKK